MTQHNGTTDDNRMYTPLPGCERRTIRLSRVSTVEQAKGKTSHPHQQGVMLRGLEDYGLEDGIPLEETYSGRKRYRPVMDQVENLIRSREYGVLMVAFADRFSRNQINANRIFAILRQYGVRLIAAYDRIDSHDRRGMQEWQESIQEAEAELHKIVRRTTTGKLRNAEDESHPQLPTGAGGSVYGYEYDRKTKTWSVNLNEAKVVLDIFTWKVAGIGSRAICNRLNDGPVQTLPPSGEGLWNTGTLTRILNRRQYTGVYEAYKPRRYSDDNEGSLRDFAHTDWAKFRREQEAGARGAIEIRGIFPQIISEELFAAAQDQAARNRALSLRNTKRITLLRGVLRCSRCGRAMIARQEGKQPDGSYRYRYYRCCSVMDLPGCNCGAPNERMDDLDMLALMVAHEVLMGDAEARDAALGTTSDRQRLVDDLADLNRQLTENLEAQDGCADSLSADLPERMKARLLANAKELGDTEKQLRWRIEVATRELANLGTGEDEALAGATRAQIMDQLQAAEPERANRIMHFLFDHFVWDDQTRMLTGYPRTRFQVTDGEMVSLGVALPVSRSPQHNIQMLRLALPRTARPYTLSLARETGKEVA